VKGIHPPSETGIQLRLVPYLLSGYGIGMTLSATRSRIGTSPQNFGAIGVTFNNVRSSSSAGVYRGSASTPALIGMLRMIVGLPARSEAGAVPRRSNLITLRCCTHIPPPRSGLDTSAALPLAVMDEHTGQHLVAATPLSVVELAKFPDPQYSIANGSPNTATRPGRGR